jgi:hypothetical protein
LLVAILARTGREGHRAPGRRRHARCRFAQKARTSVAQFHVPQCRETQRIRYGAGRPSARISVGFRVPSPTRASRYCSSVGDRATMVPDSGRSNALPQPRAARKESFPIACPASLPVHGRIAARRNVALRAYDPCKAALARAIQACESLFLLHHGGTDGGTQLVRIEKSRLCAA